MRAAGLKPEHCAPSITLFSSFMGASKVHFTAEELRPVELNFTAEELSSILELVKSLGLSQGHICAHPLPFSFQSLVMANSLIPHFASQNLV